MTDWLSTAEAANLLGYTISWTIQALRAEGVESIRRNGRGKRAALLWDRVAVERLFRERQPSQEKKALGLKRCGMCKDWKDKATEFHKRCFVCKACRPVYDSQRRNEQRDTFGNRNPDPQPPGPIGLFVAVGKPPTMETAKQYPCLFGFFQHRPLPIVDGKRVGRRKVFCPDCTAPHCYFHAHLKPAVVRKMKRVPMRPREEWG